MYASSNQSRASREIFNFFLLNPNFRPHILNKLSYRNRAHLHEMVSKEIKREIDLNKIEHNKKNV